MGSEAARGGDPAQGERVWDPALRAFHWALAGFVTASWALGEWGPGIMTLHFWSGDAIAGLLAFRLVWGIWGPETARFAHFVRGPRETLAYAATLGARRPSRWPGHNPSGGWSVIAMPGLLAASVATGLAADPDDHINRGPLAPYLPPGIAFRAAGLHTWLSGAVLGVVALHLAAIAFHWIWKREDLVRPMITGRRPPA